MLVRPLFALLTSALVFVFAAGCGDRETTPHDALLDPSIELPHAARYGKAPPREGRVTIAVTSEGRVLVDETACTLEDLAATLRERLGPVPGWGGDASDEVEEEELVEEEETEEVVEETDVRDPKRTVIDLPPRDPVRIEDDKGLRPFVRPNDVLLQLDRRVPHACVEAVLRACVSMEVRLVRLFAAVRGSDGGRGAIAVFLPMDGSLCGGRLVEGTEVELRLRKAAVGDPEAAIARALAGRRDKAGDALFVSVRPEPGTPWSTVVASMDEALAANVYAFMFEGIDYALRNVPMSRWFAEAARGSAFAAATRVLDGFEMPIDGEPQTEVVPYEPVKAGAREGYFGFSNSVTMLSEPIIEDEASADVGWKPVREK